MHQHAAIQTDPKLLELSLQLKNTYQTEAPL